MVAPRTGGRGLKLTYRMVVKGGRRRPPHRGAWIEIMFAIQFQKSAGVAPRTGGRGLKYCDTDSVQTDIEVAPRTGGRGLKCCGIWW